MPLTSTSSLGRGNFYITGTVTGWDMTREGDSYGIRSFTAEMTDNQLHMYNYANYTYVRLGAGDYQYTRLYFPGFYVADPVVSATGYSTTARANNQYRPLLLQVELNGGWVDYGQIQKQLNGQWAFTPLGSAPAVATASALNIPLPAGTTGIKYLYTDKAVSVSFSGYSYLTTELLPSATVLGLMAGRDGASVRNTVTLQGIDDQGVTRAPMRTAVASHSLTRIKGENYYSKSAGTVSNNVTTSQYYFPITLTAYSLVTHPEKVLEEVLQGDYVTQQKVSTFYDLLPPGAFADLSSIRVTGYGGTLGNTTFPHRLEVYDNWKGSGRTMLIVHAQVPDGVTNFYHVVSGTYSTLYSGMTLRFNMYNKWLNVVDNGPYLYNYSAYESQDGALPSGYPDNAASGSIPAALKAAFTDLNRDGNPAGTLNSFMYANATPYFVPLKAAELGFHKAVSSPEDPAYGSHTEVQAGGEYTYRLRLENAVVSTKDLVFYDILENAFGSNDHWQGGLMGVDVSQAQRQGIDVKVYYSLNDPTDAGIYADADHLDNNPSFWQSWNINPPADPSQVRALAFDLRRRTNGTEFVAAPNQSVMVFIQMRAPVDAQTHIANHDLAYNRAFAANRKSDILGKDWDIVKAIEASNIVTVGLRDMGLTFDKVSNPVTGTQATPATVYGGDSLEYRLSLSNLNLAQSLQNIVVEDVIPDGLLINLAGIQVMQDDNPNTLQPIGLSTRVDLVSAVGQKLTFRVISLAGHEKISLIIPTTVLPMAQDKAVDFVNTARITSVFNQAFSLDSPTTYHRQQYAEVTLSGSKTLLGRDMVAGEFAFLLTDASGNTLQRLLSAPSPDGVAAPFASNTLYFDKPGTYSFGLREEIGSLDSVVYDPVSYEIQVTVTQDDQGGLSQTHTIQAGGVEQSALAFANTHATTQYAATKKWIYPAGATPPSDPHPSVDLQLYRDGEAYSPDGLVKMVPASGTVEGGTTSLTHTWTDLPRYRADGALNADGSRAESVYTFKEVLVPDGYLKLRPADAPDTVENIYWPGARTLHKFWDGPVPQPSADGQSLVNVTITQQIYTENGTLIASRPYSIDPDLSNPFVIQMNGIADPFPDPAPTDPYKLYGEFTSWTYTIGLPSNGTYNNQQVNFYYTFNEIKIPADYKVKETNIHDFKGGDITNAYGFTSFIATKKWIDGPEDERPPVTIRLQRRYIDDNGEPKVEDVRDSNGDSIIVVLNGTDDGNPTGEIAPLDKNTWRYRWDELPRYVRWNSFPDDQREYTYSFIEDAVAIEKYYKASYNEDHTTVFNTYTPPLFDLVAKKHWVKGNAADYHPAPLTLTRQLLGAEAETVLDAYTVLPQETGAAEYTYTWKGLPETDIAGKPYTYAVRETAEEGRGYVVVAGQIYDVKQTGYDITNTYRVPMADVLAAKFWVGGLPEDHKVMEFKLFRNLEGEIISEAIDWPYQVTGEAPNFLYRWENLPQTDEFARPYVYTVEETAAREGVVTVGGRAYEVHIQDRVVSNVYVPPLADVRASKHWVGGVAADDHQPVQLLLYRSLPGGVPVLVEAAYTVTGAAPDFTYTWPQLPQTNLQAAPYTYTVLEADVDEENHIHVNGRHFTVSQDGMAVTNTYDPLLTNVVAVKTWAGGPEADHTPVNLVLSRQVAGGTPETVEAEYSVSGTAPQFAYIWVDLPMTDMNARDYLYSVSEEGVTGGRVLVNGNSYEVTSQVDALGHTQLTNTYLPPQRVTLSLLASKVLAGQATDMREGRFAFSLTGGGLELTAANDAAGKVVFPAFALEKPGEYRFILRETPGTETGMQYDSAAYTAVVTVTLNANLNRLEHSVSWLKDGAVYASSLPVFTNTYAPTPEPVYDAISVPISGQKQLVNQTLKAGAFQFVIKDHAGTVLEKVTNDAAGSFAFTPIRQRRPGVFLFHVTEVKGNLPQVEYDAASFTVRVEVSDQGGKLRADVSFTRNGTPIAGGIRFVNSVALPATGDSHLWAPILLLGLSGLLFGLRRRPRHRR